MGGIAVRAPVPASMFVIVALANPCDARLVQLHRRAHDLAWGVQRRASNRDMGLPDAGSIIPIGVILAFTF
jgi:hypothetical protein